MSDSPALAILTLTEDSGGDADETIAELVRAVLLHLQPGCDLSRVRIEPLDEEREQHLRTTSHGSFWKADKTPADKARRIELCQRIATQLVLRERPGFVVYHIDGDKPWSQRANSENAEKFRRLILKPVTELVSRQLEKRKKPGERADRMSRLFLFMPFAEMEAWLFQNTVEVRRILEESWGGSHLHVVMAWEQDRTLPDELADAKAALPFGAGENLRLASRNYPVAAVESAACSFADAVAAMRRSQPFLDALGRTALADPA